MGNFIPFYASGPMPAPRQRADNPIPAMMMAAMQNQTHAEDSDKQMLIALMQIAAGRASQADTQALTLKLQEIADARDDRIIKAQDTRADKDRALLQTQIDNQADQFTKSLEASNTAATNNYNLQKRIIDNNKEVSDKQFALQNTQYGDLKTATDEAKARALAAEAKGNATTALGDMINNLAETLSAANQRGRSKEVRDLTNVADRSSEAISGALRRIDTTEQTYAQTPKTLEGFSGLVQNVNRQIMNAKSDAERAAIANANIPVVDQAISDFKNVNVDLTSPVEDLGYYSPGGLVGRLLMKLGGSDAPAFRDEKAIKDIYKTQLNELRSTLGRLKDSGLSEAVADKWAEKQSADMSKVKGFKRGIQNKIAAIDASNAATSQPSARAYYDLENDPALAELFTQFFGAPSSAGSGR